MGQRERVAEYITPEADAIDLIERCIAGDDEAFHTLFETYKNVVFRSAYLLLGNHSEAEDVLQEVFVRIYRHLGTFDPSKASFTTWIYRITVNHCRSEWKKRRVSVTSIEDMPSLDSSDNVPIEDHLAEREAIRGALYQLSDRLRTVLVLRYYAGLSYAEISQVLRIPIGTVRSRLHAAHKAMRKHLGSAGESQSRPTGRRQWHEL